MAPPDDECFTDHSEQRPILAHIKELNVKLNLGLTCHECISALLLSFPGVRKLTFQGSFTEAQARLIFTSMPNLEELTLIGNVTSTIFSAAAYHPDSIEGLKNLKSLKFFNDSFFGVIIGDLNNQSLLEFASLPQLKSLYIKDPSNVSVLKI